MLEELFQVLARRIRGGIVVVFIVYFSRGTARGRQPKPQRTGKASVRFFRRKV